MSALASKLLVASFFIGDLLVSELDFMLRTELEFGIQIMVEFELYLEWLSCGELCVEKF